MKSLIKGGLFLALGWLANDVGAQEIQWRASSKGAQNPIPATGVPAQGNPSLSAETSLRVVSMGEPTRRDAAVKPPMASFRPLTNSPGAIIRGQAPDDKTGPVIPQLEVRVGEPTQAKPLPKDKGFTPPPPAPSPVFGSLGMNEEGFCGAWNCGPRYAFAGAGRCADRPCWWISGEYLMWWQRSQNVPPLVTAGPLVGGTGQLNDPTTRILYDSTPNHAQSGGRFTAGFAFPRCCNLGFEATYFFLGRQSATATYGTDENTQIFRPFFDAEMQRFDAEFANTVTVQSFSQLWGIEGNFRSNWRRGSNCWIDILGGYRHLNLSEGIDITEVRQVPLAQTGGVPGVSALEQESFRTRTQFNGFQFGLDGEWRCWHRLFFGMTTKIATGMSHQIINIDGNTTFNGPAPIGTVTQQGALLASSTNIGRHTSNRFAVLPEVSLKVGIDITDHLRIFAGYDFLYLSSVVRPGEQIDLNVAPSYRPTIFGAGAGGGPRQPAVLYRTSDYWAQGFNFGLQCRY